MFYAEKDIKLELAESMGKCLLAKKLLKFIPMYSSTLSSFLMGAKALFLKVTEISGAIAFRIKFLSVPTGRIIARIITAI
jgi:hypothetical protein